MVSFHVGQKVVCVDAKPRYLPDEIYLSDEFELEEGKVYTIRSIGFDEFQKQEVIIRLFEIFREPGGDETEESGFMAYRFRPVTERKTSIAIFHEILKTQRVGVDA